MATGLLLSRLLPVQAGPYIPLTLFAEAAWYQQEKVPERSFEGVLSRQAGPMATAGRWNPVQLISAEPGGKPPIRRAVYLGGNPTRLDHLIGRRVRIEGKWVPVLKDRELWPARITALSDGNRP
ncbi:MAG: hypothetical protein QM522_08800 [Chitinophagaceae bacterium]|nr:hypothetical protein [Chitinophagaceae bacterium]